MKPKKVFQVRDRVFWACNGQMIRDMVWMEWRLNNEHWMKRLSLAKPIRVELVKPPADRCRHCGEKINEKEKEADPPSAKTK